MKKIKKELKPRKSILRFFFFGLTSIIVITLILVSISHVGMDIYKKYIEKEDLEKKLISLRTKEEALAVDVEKMQNPEYVARYLREKFLYSKNGEFVIRIPEGK